jgi:Ni/Co efflux regulator RcnB
MRKLAILSLAAGAAILPAAAAAQPAAAGAHAPGGAGHSWDRGGPRPGMSPAMRPPHAAPPRAHLPQGSPPHVGAGQHGWVFPSHYRGPRFGHVPQLYRGHRMAHFWFGPQFHVRNWQMYGFHRPQPGHRWVRHYDDAYLIDEQGIVMDGRHGLDWDQYGEQWAYDQGIPQYVGSGDYHPDGRDHAWVEQHGHLGYAEGPSAGHGAYHYGGQQQAPYGYHQMGYAPLAYGYQGGYGYGCNCVTVTTTTTTTTSPVVTTRTYVTEEYVTEQVARPQVKRRAVRRAAPPRIAPVRGERG